MSVEKHLAFYLKPPVREGKDFLITVEINLTSWQPLILISLRKHLHLIEIMPPKGPTDFTRVNPCAWLWLGAHIIEIRRDLLIKFVMETTRLKYFSKWKLLQSHGTLLQIKCNSMSISVEIMYNHTLTY